MRYKLSIVAGIALAAVLAFALFQLWSGGNKSGANEPAGAQQVGGPVLSCPFNLTQACTSKGLFPPTPSRGAPVHWTAATL